MRNWVQRKAKEYGVEIRKAPFKYAPVSVFDLAVAYLQKTKGASLRFVEVGANDGKSSDPMYPYITEQGWTGLLVEPQPVAFARLKQNYEAYADALQFENVAISSAPGHLSLFVPPDWALEKVGNTQVGANAARTARTTGIKQSELKEIKVPTARLDDLIARHTMGEIDVLQLDTEGYELDVLRTLDLKSVRPRIITFEHGMMAPKLIQEMADFLSAADYELSYGGYQSDSVALPKEFLG